MNDEPRESRDQPSKADPSESSSPPPVQPGETAPANTLTPEEQMALFEKELKETDWGHQPC